MYLIPQEAAIAAGVLGPMVALLTSSASSPSSDKRDVANAAAASVAASRCIGALLASPSAQGSVLEAGGLRAMVDLLLAGGSASPEAREEAVLGVVELAKNPQHHAAMDEAGCVQPLVGMLGKGAARDMVRGARMLAHRQQSNLRRFAIALFSTSSPLSLKRLLCQIRCISSPVPRLSTGLALASGKTPVALWTLHLVLFGRV